MIRVLLVGLAVLLLAPYAEATHCGGDAACWEREAREVDARRGTDAWSAAVALCRQRVQSVSAGFDAHVPEPGRVRLFGTDRARYEFQKCMNDQGQRTEGR